MKDKRMKGNMEIYLDIETLNSPGEGSLVQRLEKIISVNVIVNGEFEMFKEWKRGEKAMLQESLGYLFPENRWEYTKVGFNLAEYDFVCLAKRLKFHRLWVSPLEELVQRPFVDLAHYAVIVNGGKFKGTKEALGLQSGGGSSIREWYLKKKYSEIEDYSRREAQRTWERYLELINDS